VEPTALSLEGYRTEHENEGQRCGETAEQIGAVDDYAGDQRREGDTEERLIRRSRIISLRQACSSNAVCVPQFGFGAGASPRQACAGPLHLAPAGGSAPVPRRVEFEVITTRR
jgi:hypothetical protein